MLEELDPGRHYRAKIENGIAYTVQCAFEAATNRKAWIAAGVVLLCYLSFEAGYMFGQLHMRAAMRRAYNLAPDCEVVVIPTDAKNTTELYQLCE
jgi:hypothetical protein